MNDATILLRDIAGDAAQSAASRVNPSEDQLNQIDHAAADNTWHDVPDLSRDNLKGQLKGKYNQQKPFGKDDLKQAGNTAQDTANQRSNEVNGVADSEGNVDPDATRDVAANSADNAQAQLRQKASENVPDETKEKGNKAIGKSKNYISNKMPKERREQTIWRLKKMIVEIQGHEDYQQAIETLLTLAETYHGHGKDIAGQSVGTVKEAHGDSALQVAENDLKVRIYA